MIFVRAGQLNLGDHSRRHTTLLAKDRGNSAASKHFNTDYAEKKLILTALMATLERRPPRHAGEGQYPRLFFVRAA
jgi:hypothetical protein